MPDDNNKDVNTFTDYRVHPGMLSSPQIEYYQDRYKIIDGYVSACLGPASYHMRVGGDVLTWHEGSKVEFTLAEYEDINRRIKKSVELQPNSLTFLTTIEEFRLPKDIIARFNLKSKWVHQGLLLGTGPIVDPQLHARLLIPVHNFSSQVVVMNYGEEFISVEFTKTLNPEDELLLLDGRCAHFEENKNWNFDFKKYRERIANKKVESSVLSQFRENNKQIELSRTTISDAKKDLDKTIESVRRFNIISFVGIVLAAFALVLTSWQLIESTHDKADAAYNLVKEYKENKFDFRSFALKSSVADLQKDISELQRRIDNDELNMKMGNRPIDLKAIQAGYDEKIRIMESRILELEKLLPKPSVGK